MGTDGAFIFIGYLPNTENIKGFVNLNNRGEIIVDGDMKTNISGVFAAGDCIVKKYRQVTTAVADGTIQTIGTDHCPFTLDQKKLGIHDFTKIPNGAGGIEQRIALLYTYGVLTNRINLNRFVNLVSTQPAKIFGLYPKKGVVKIGSDADIVVWDPEKENIISAQTHHQNCDINIYEGFKAIGEAKYVILGGDVKIRKVQLRSGNESRHL